MTIEFSPISGIVKTSRTAWSTETICFFTEAGSVRVWSSRTGDQTRTGGQKTQSNFHHEALLEEHSRNGVSEQASDEEVAQRQHLRA